MQIYKRRIYDTRRKKGKKRRSAIKEKHIERRDCVGVCAYTAQRESNGEREEVMKGLASSNHH